MQYHRCPAGLSQPVMGPRLGGPLNDPYGGLDAESMAAWMPSLWRPVCRVSARELFLAAAVATTAVARATAVAAAACHCYGPVVVAAAGPGVVTLRRLAPTCPAAEPLQARRQGPIRPCRPTAGPLPALRRGSQGLDKPDPGVADIKHSSLRKAIQKLHAAASRTSRYRIKNPAE